MVSLETICVLTTTESRAICVCLCYAFLCVLSSFAFILKRKRGLVALLLLSCGCLVAYVCSVAFPKCRG